MKFFAELGIQESSSGTSSGLEWLHDNDSQWLKSYSPADGALLGEIALSTESTYNEVVERANIAFLYWRNVPAPKRGEIVRQIGNKLRKYKEPLGKLVSLEMGKIYQEGLGEVQEMIDVCDLAVGLSRQLYGLTIVSERADHKILEQWHPMGPVGIITAFNFPVAVWAWNAMIAAVCGDVCIWKPSEKTPLCALAVQNIVAQVIHENNLPEGIFNLVTGNRYIGELIAKDSRVPIVSATGSVRMGMELGPIVAARFGRSILELGGNNAIVITQSADINMALRAIVFGAAGTAGQRCTTTRRLIIHESIFDELKSRLLNVYSQLKIGHPLEEGTIVGPLIDPLAVEMFQKAITNVEKEGGRILIGGKVLAGKQFSSGCYVTPSIAEVSPDMPILQEETFAPLLYIMKYETFEEAIAIHNSVPQGLSSAIFSLDMREVEKFISAAGSDCGMANVNIGTSGAEIGGAFGGEKVTGGGRESGSDSWKGYMRRQTNTINYGNSLPLAQGIEFPI